MTDQIISPAPAQPALSMPQIVECLREAHDASLDDDHRAARSMLLTAISSLEAAATPAPAPATDKPGLTVALDIRTDQGWKINGGPVPVLYTDEINGQQVCRDDIWLCRTQDLAQKVEQPVGIMARATISTSSGAGYKQISLQFAELHDAEQVRRWAVSCGAQPAVHRESLADALKDHQVREVISAVTRVAQAFNGAQQLRERIASILRPLLKREPADIDRLINSALTGGVPAPQQADHLGDANKMVSSGMGAPSTGPVSTRLRRLVKLLDANQTVSTDQAMGAMGCAADAIDRLEAEILRCKSAMSSAMAGEIEAARDAERYATAKRLLVSLVLRTPKGSTLTVTRAQDANSNGERGVDAVLDALGEAYSDTQVTGTTEGSA